MEKIDEVRNSEKIIIEFFNETEKVLCKTIGQMIEISGGHLADEIDPDQVKMINTGLQYWHKTKNLVIEYMRLNKKNSQLLNERLDRQEKLLLEISSELAKKDK